MYIDDLNRNNRRTADAAMTNARWLYTGAGTLLIALGTRSRSGLLGLALSAIGGGLVYKGATGQDPIERVQRFASSARRRLSRNGRPISIRANAYIERTPSEVYDYWRTLSNLPSFLGHLERVSALDMTRSHWVAHGPLGTRLEWDAELVNDARNEELVWRSVEGSEFENWGRVRFRPATNGRGTEVEVRLHYMPPSGPMSAMFAEMFGNDLSRRVAADLQQLKQMLEEEIAPEASAKETKALAVNPRNGHDSEPPNPASVAELPRGTMH